MDRILSRQRKTVCSAADRSAPSFHQSYCHESRHRQAALPAACGAPYGGVRDVPAETRQASGGCQSVAGPASCGRHHGRGSAAVHRAPVLRQSVRQGVAPAFPRRHTRPVPAVRCWKNRYCLSSHSHAQEWPARYRSPSGHQCGMALFHQQTCIRQARLPVWHMVQTAMRRRLPDLLATDCLQPSGKGCPRDRHHRW